jgi:hypothetical protein
MQGIRRAIPTALIIVAAASSCGGGANDRPRQPGGPTDRVGGATSTVSVVLDDYTVTPDRTTVPSGTVIFEVSVVPDAKRPHDFSVYRTDLAPDRLPLGTDEVHIDVTDERLEVVGFFSEITEQPQTLRTELTPGKYVLVCNSENHYLKDMWAAFHVT